MNTIEHVPPQGEYWSAPYYIYEGDSGLQISESRVLLFDLMQYL